VLGGFHTTPVPWMLVKGCGGVDSGEPISQYSIESSSRSEEKHIVMIVIFIVAG
jgi:hypothetical protein